MPQVIQRSFAAIVAILITSATFSEAISLPAPQPAGAVATPELA